MNAERMLRLRSTDCNRCLDGMPRILIGHVSTFAAVKHCALVWTGPTSP